MELDKFIFLSEEAKEKVAAMSDCELDALVSYIAYGMRKSMMEMEEENRCKAALHEVKDEQ